MSTCYTVNNNNIPVTKAKLLKYGNQQIETHGTKKKYAIEHNRQIFNTKRRLYIDTQLFTSNCDGQRLVNIN